MSPRVRFVTILGVIVFLLATVGLFAVYSFIVGRMSPPTIAVEPTDRPTEATDYVSCGDGTIALSEGDCRLESQTQKFDGPPTVPHPTVGGSRDTSSDGDSGDCRALDRGTLENNPTFSVDAVTQVNYWSEGNPEYDVIVGPGTYSRPGGYGGRIWEWVGCTEAEVESQVEASWPRRREDGVNVGGWGDPSVLTKLS